jgi:D-tyrosyl-tRNA(Tyr) deacylase
MRAIIQRVSEAGVTIEQQLYASIGIGLLVLVGVEENDTKQDAEWLAGKIRQMRIFSDENGKMNLSIEDIKGEYLVISQFTLHALTAKGNRPSFIKAARPEQAIPLYEYFKEQLKSNSDLSVKSGVFGADMKVNLINDGPVTISIDTKNRE